MIETVFRFSMPKIGKGIPPELERQLYGKPFVCAHGTWRRPGVIRCFACWPLGKPRPLARPWTGWKRVAHMLRDRAHDGIAEIGRRAVRLKQENDALREQDERVREALGCEETDLETAQAARMAMDGSDDRRRELAVARWEASVWEEAVRRASPAHHMAGLSELAERYGIPRPNDPGGTA